MSALKPPFYSARRASLCLAACLWGLRRGLHTRHLSPSACLTAPQLHMSTPLCSGMRYFWVLLLTETCCVESPFDIGSLYQQYYITFLEMCNPQV